ncbi:hypothetical protein RMN57_29755 [Kitasatospora sp. CM 4170]|uniref:Proteinase inhibitor I42 chagasin domain-containing protein n=1 Tax=Kitasatospora aburaviensis TaxID=67265 RepID=A0ABW1EP50_9ACTN|nr:hypothetical protein [Kitasatospora sp. CM 4170]WNM48575.1 hypothetical protein RMN57_29755 [Kitasatospora sp. CM 4170]
MAAALVVVATAAGCSSSAADGPGRQPDTVLALPADKDADAVGGGRQPAFEPSEVHLAVGGSVGVSLTSAPLPHGWQLAGEGDPAIVRRGPDAPLSSCPADSAGCGHTVRQTWTAVTAGSTTLTWHFVDRTSCGRGTGGSATAGSGTAGSGTAGSGTAGSGTAGAGAGATAAAGTSAGTAGPASSCKVLAVKEVRISVG